MYDGLNRQFLLETLAMTAPSMQRHIDRLLRQQASLAAFGSYAFSEPQLGKILTEAARVCAEGLGVPFCKVCRYRAEENDLLIVAGWGWHEGVVGCVVSAANETSPQGRAYVTGEPVILSDLRKANDVVLPAFYGEHGIISTVDVIIKGKEGDAYGVLEIDNPEQHTYDRHDIDFLTGFANVLAEAVATANRSEILRNTVHQMEALVEEKDKLLAERTMMAEELKHRVRNNLQLIQAMLFSHMKIGSGEEEQASARAISRRVVTLSEVYEQLLGTGLDRTIDFGEYMRALCGRLPGLQGGATGGITLLCEAEVLLVDLDTVTAMGMAVAEIVSNSFEHAFPGGAGTVSVRLVRSADGRDGLLTVADDGVGFVEKPGSKRHGVGLVRRLVQQVQGGVTRGEGPGTTWALSFPLHTPPQEPLPAAAQ